MVCDKDLLEGKASCGNFKDLLLLRCWRTASCHEHHWMQLLKCVLYEIHVILVCPCTNIWSFTFWYLLRSSVMEKGPLSVASGLIHVCICTISEMLYQYIRTLWGIILCNWSSKCNVYSGLWCNLKVGIIKHILLMVFICLLIHLLLWSYTLRLFSWPPVHFMPVYLWYTNFYVTYLLIMQIKVKQ